MNAIAFIALILFSVKASGQSPSYYCELRNDEKVSGNIYEIDIYLFRRGAIPLELASFQVSLSLNPAFVNGGTLTPEILAGSSGLNPSQQPDAVRFDPECIQIAPSLPARTYDESVHTTTTYGTIIPPAGLRVCRLRLTNTVNFGSPWMNPSWNYTILPYRTVVTAYTGPDPDYKANTLITSELNHSKNLNVKLFLEGLYSVYEEEMKKTRNSDGETDWENFPGSTVDTFSVCIAQNTSPWNLVAQSHGIPLNTDGSCRVPVPPENTGYYYIEVNHRNSVETWSKEGGESFFDAIVYYDFTLSPSQAFGGNLSPMGSKWALFGGDVTQDGYLDGSDVADVFNQNQLGGYGYSSADVNGDGWCDGSDVALVFNNNQTGAGKITPATTPDYRQTGKRKHKTVNNPTKIQ